jgi:hypothetical protein
MMKEAALLALSEGMEIDQIQITETGCKRQGNTGSS